MTQNRASTTEDWPVVFNVRCRCGRWLGDVVVRYNEDRILSVRGACKRHGEVEAETWGCL